jgi:O-antigen/teichoic acid export membrane protein
LQLCGRIPAAALQAVIFVLLARDVRPLVFGWIAAINGITTVAATTFDLGLVPYIAKYQVLGDRARVRTAIDLNTISTLLLGLVCALPMELIYGTDLPLAVPLFITLGNAIDKNVETLCAIPVAEGATGYSAASILLRRVSWLVLFIAFGAMGLAAPLGFSLAWVISEIFGQVHAQPIARRWSRGEDKRHPWVGTIREAVPFWITAVTYQARLLDAPIVASIASAAQAGYYSAATKIVAPFLLIPGTLTSLVLPNAIRGTRHDARRAAAYLCLGTIGAAIMGTALLPIEHWAVLALFGHSYGKAAPVLGVALIAAPFVILCGPLGSLLMAHGRERFVAVAGSAAGAAMVVALVVGAVAGGAVGAALGLGIAFLLQCALLAGGVAWLI